MDDTNARWQILIETLGCTIAVLIVLAIIVAVAAVVVAALG